MGDQPFLQVVARADMPGSRDRDEVQQLLDEAEDVCPQLDLTGVQIALGSSLVKVVEGPEQEVLSRMEQISTDPRCSRMTVLREGYVQDRRFATWKSADLTDAEIAGVDWNEADRFAAILSRGLRRAAV